jgi:DNA-binding Xre family transcriptional regulator
MSEQLLKRTRIRVLGEKAAATRAWLDDVAPAAQIVGDNDPAEYVLLALDDLSDLLEEAAATSAYQHTRDQESVPAAMARRLIAGENPIKVWREHRGLTLEELHRRTLLTKGYLSLLENGERRGTVTTLKEIAKVLAVSLDELV